MQDQSPTDVKLRKTSKKKNFKINLHNRFLFFFIYIDIDSSNNNLLLHRALSTVSANQTLVNNQRNVLAKNYRRTSINDDIVTIDHNDADALFILPNLYELPELLRLRVMDNLVDIQTMLLLEDTSNNFLF
jgi:hypothetical protein